VPAEHPGAVGRGGHRLVDEHRVGDAGAVGRVDQHLPA
jgi:hypothetical protein